MSDLRVLIIGKTGNGKSSLGNTLLGRPDAFRVENSMYSVTAKCQWELGNIDGKTIEVTDTPGLCDTNRKKDSVYIEIAKSTALTEPGPHAILFVLKANNRFTQDEYDAFRALKVLFSEDLCKFLIIVFTEIDSFGKTLAQQREGLKREVEDPRAEDSHLKDVLDEADNRYIGISNKSSDAVRIEQRTQLITMMQDLKRSNDNKYYSSVLLEEVKQNLETIIAEILASQKVAFPEASIMAKRRIVEEFPDPTFWDRITTVVSRHYKRVNNRLCSVM